MSTIDNIVSDLRKAIESAKSGKTQAYDTVATVKRVAGNTAWVQIPGGTSETPVQLTIACQPGDTVQVRVGGGRAWLTGNQSAPPTDDTTARSAQTRASEAKNAAGQAQESADVAQTTADGAKVSADNAQRTAERVEDSVDTVSDTWKNRPKANMVKWLMKQSGVSLEVVAAHLGCSVSYMNNKLTRDSFSFEDLILAAYACGYTFVLVNNNEEISSEDSFRVDLFQHFENEEGQEVLERINAIEEEKKKAKRAEYEAKKAELERMKAEYGFED